MRPTRSLAGLVALLSATACTTTMDEPMGSQNMLFVGGPVPAGGQAAAVFRNSSGTALAVGDLACALDVQRSTHGTWESLASDQVCRARALTRIVAAGDSLMFTFSAPAAPGLYRIQTAAMLQAPSDTGQQSLVGPGMTVLGSAPFVTTP